MRIRAFWAGGFSAVSYFVTDDAYSCAAIIDPAIPYATVAHEISPMPPTTAILLTHGHFDHMLTLSEWKEKTKAPICISAEDAPALSDATLNCNRIFFGKDITYPTADRLLRDGEIISLGAEALTVMKTPGHTVGSSVYIGKEDIFTGDTMMTEGSYGRYDLPGGSAATLYESLRRIASLTGDYRIHPGHGQSGTLAEERKYYLR